MKIARFRFDADLQALLQHAHEGGAFDYAFNGPQSVKHLVESVGIPHTEFGAARANSLSVSPAYIVQHGDLVDVQGHPPEVLAEEPRFVLDGHLGRLAAHLRMLGLDTLYDSGYADQTLASIAAFEERIVLSRDRRLLMRKTVTRGYLVRSLDPEQQLIETVRRYRLLRWARPFRRCIRCNHPLEPVDKAAVLNRLEPLTKLYFEEFRICPACRQVYWKGSHFERMEGLIARLKEQEDGESP